jgi:hypothetical protein
MKIEIITDTKLKTKKYDNQITKDPDRVFSHSFVMLICGSRGSGKSNLLTNIVCRKKPFLKGLFNKIFLFSPTAKSDTKICSNIVEKISFGNYYDKYDDEVLQSILDEQMEKIEEYGRDVSDKLLFIFDDLVSDGTAFNNSKNAITKLIFNSRHYNASVIILAQRYVSVPRNIRTNAQIIFCRLENEKEIDTLISEISFIPVKKLKEVYDYVIKEPYKFLGINYQQGDPLKRFYSNFFQLKLEEDEKIN